MDERDETLITLTADIVAAHVSNNNVAIGDVSMLIERVHGALKGLGADAAPAAEELKPAVSVRASVKPDYVVCLECGSKQKMLKRHLSTAHDTTPADYRAKWNLPASYPMTAPNYAAQRKALALKIGLGKKSAPAKSEKKPAPKSSKGRLALKHD